MQDVKEAIAAKPTEAEPARFDLEASETELLEEFGVLMMWEYNYAL